MEILVVAAAIRKGGKEGLIFSLPRPNRHHNIIHAMHSLQEGLAKRDCEQGFLLTNGRFVSRAQALQFAYLAGQLKPENKVGNPTELYSEDLW